MGTKKKKTAVEAPDPVATEPNELVFDAATRAYLGEIDDAQMRAVQAAVAPFVAERQTVMRHALRLAGLTTGDWDPKPDGSGMVRKAPPAPTVRPEAMNPTRRKPTT